MGTQATEVCQVWSEEDTIVQDTWMTIVVQYNSTANEMVIHKNGRLVGGPTVCSAAPPDRNTSISYVGKSMYTGDAYFNGEMSRLYVADLILRDVARSCEIQCSTLQSSTQSAASKVVDASVESCSQTWRQSWPWWRIDLEVPRLVVSVRVHGRTDCCQDELEGFEIRVGNWPTWENNPACASNVPAPDAHQSSVDVMCQAEGRFVFIVIPGTNRSLALCDIEIMGLPVEGTAISGLIPNCTACIPGASVLLFVCVML